MSAILGDAHMVAVLLLAGFLPNEIWRLFGLLIGRRIDEGSEVLTWVRAVAAAILAGVIAQIVITPPGVLAMVPSFVRYAAMAVGFAVYLGLGRSVFAGVVAGELVVLAGGWWFG